MSWCLGHSKTSPPIRRVYMKLPSGRHAVFLDLRSNPRCSHVTTFLIVERSVGGKKVNKFKKERKKKGPHNRPGDDESSFA